MSAIKTPIPGVIYQKPERAQRFIASGAWVDKTVGDALRATASRFPDRPAFISEERSLTFAALDDESERLAAAMLQSGVRTGDRALFQMGTNVDTCIALLACYKAGVIPVCSLPQHREIEIGQLARQSRATAYFVQADFSVFDLVGFAAGMQQKIPELKHLIVARGVGAAPFLNQAKLIDSVDTDAAKAIVAKAPVGSQDVLSFQLSGGTTGIPKIIPRFHAEYLGHSKAWADRYRVTSESRVIWSLPLLHNAGQLYALIPPILMGVTTVLMPKVEVREMLDLIEKHRVTHALSIGPIAPQLLAYQDIASYDLSSLQLFATMSRADNLEAHIRVPCSNLFGITEGLLLGSPADDPAFVRHKTQGRSGCPDDEIRLLDPDSEEPVKPGQMGELCFRGPSSLLGFYDAPEANAKAFTSDGFYRTGDMMTAHEVDGHTFYAFEGRLRDNINRGGEKIGCEEVEGYVCQHPAVADAKLVAMPDPFYGEKGCVFIIPRPNHAAPDVKELLQFLTGLGLAKYKCPERVEVVDSFPVTRVGKLDKVALKRQILDKMATESAS